MSRRLKLTGYLAMLVGVFWLSACAGADPEPAVDPNLIYTQAAETVQAQLSATAAMLPTSTPTPEPTATEPPTATPEPPTATPQAALPTLSGPGTEAAPPGTAAEPTSTQAPLLPTATQAVQKQGDHAQWVGNVPADGSTFGRGEQFMFVFRIMNTGTTTWGKDYSLVFLNGTGLSSVNSISLDKETKPGGVGEFYIQVFAPLDAGDYISRWKLVNPQGVFIYEVYFAFKIK